jgi:hypothetical protein
MPPPILEPAMSVGQGKMGEPIGEAAVTESSPRKRTKGLTIRLRWGFFKQTDF